ncbi:MAG: PKD domain-containing protein, partial [Thermoplasmatota archaeon]
MVNCNLYNFSLHRSFSYGYRLDFDNNFYNNFGGYYPYVVCLDGLHWTQGHYVSPYGPYYDPRPHVFPIGYNGSKLPVFVEDLTPSEFDGGNPLNFSVNITDFHWIVEAWVNITYLNGSTYRYMLSKGEGDNWFVEVPTEMDPISIDYNFTAISRAGFMNTTETGSVEFADHTPPILVTDYTPTRVGTGDPLKFLLKAEDRSGISKGYVKYWYGDVYSPTLELEGGEYLSYETLAPKRTLETLNYRFLIYDGEGNFLITSNRSIELFDNDAPVAFAGQDVECYEGDTVYFNGIKSTDNIGISEYHWFVSEYGDEIVLEGPTVDYTFHLRGKYEVRLVVEDFAGNRGTHYITVNVSARPSPADRIDVRVGPVMNEELDLVLDAVVTVEYGSVMIHRNPGLQGFAVFSLPSEVVGNRIGVHITCEGYKTVYFQPIVLNSGNLSLETPVLVRTGSEQDDDVGWDGEDDKANYL